MKPIRSSSLLAWLGCVLFISQVNDAPGQSSAEVLFGPTPTQIVVRVEATFEVIDAFDIFGFRQIYSYQSGGPYYWEAGLVELQSPDFGDGSPALVIECYNGLEQGLEVFLPNEYLRSHGAFDLNSDPTSPRDGVEGVDWSFWLSEAVPMSLQGRVTYDAENNIAHVCMTFIAGLPPTPAELIVDLIQFVEGSADIDDQFEKQLVKSLGDVLDAVKAGKTKLAGVYLRSLIKRVEAAQSSKRRVISEDAAEHICSSAKLIAQRID